MQIFSETSLFSSFIEEGHVQQLDFGDGFGFELPGKKMRLMGGKAKGNSAGG